ncbi:hypothetical protein [Pseudoroseicyclus sp. CXY001]|uniref:hypothetical protein n=1 Tax=Pseudoroseicyclus sp. CXY001 TaxID=3242492 RepID=UPI00358DBFC3
MTAAAAKRGLIALIDANRDRLFYALVIVVLLGASAWVSSLDFLIRTTVGQPV